MRSRTARGANISALYHWTLGAVRLSPPLWQAPKSRTNVRHNHARRTHTSAQNYARHAAPDRRALPGLQRGLVCFFRALARRGSPPVSGATLIEYRPRPRRNDLRHRLNAGSRRPDQSSRRGSERVVREHMQHSASVGRQNDAHVPWRPQRITPSTRARNLDHAVDALASSRFAGAHRHTLHHGAAAPRQGHRRYRQ